MMEKMDGLNTRSIALLTEPMENSSYEVMLIGITEPMTGKRTDKFFSSMMTMGIAFNLRVAILIPLPVSGKVIYW